MVAMVTKSARMWNTSVISTMQIFVGFHHKF